MQCVLQLVTRGILLYYVGGSFRNDREEGSPGCISKKANNIIGCVRRDYFQ